MSFPAEIADSEIVGRCVFDSEKARAAVQGKIHPNIFKERAGQRELSVDRLSFNEHAALAALHDAERLPQNFHGWATLLVEQAREDGRAVISDPIDDENLKNPFHALIVLPPLDNDDATEVQRQHSLAMARKANWLPRPA